MKLYLCHVKDSYDSVFYYLLHGMRFRAMICATFALGRPRRVAGVMFSITFCSASHTSHGLLSESQLFLWKSIIPLRGNMLFHRKSILLRRNNMLFLWKVCLSIGKACISYRKASFPIGKACFPYRKACFSIGKACFPYRIVCFSIGKA